MRDQHAVGGAVSHRQRGCGDQVDARGHAHQLVGPDAAELRHAAVEHLALQLEVPGERIDDRRIAGLPAGHPRPDLVHHARHVEPEHDGQRHLDARHALHGEQVVMVERGRRDLQATRPSVGAGFGWSSATATFSKPPWARSSSALNTVSGEMPVVILAR